MLMDGLLVSGGLKWHIRRKLLTPSFHFQILQDFVPLLQKQSDILVSQFLELSKEPWFNIYPVMKLCTLNIFLKTALGLDVHSENEETKTFFNAIEKFSEVTQFKITRPWIILDVLYNLIFPAANVNTYISIVHSFFRKLLAAKKNRVLASRKSTEIADDGLKEDKKQDHQVFGAKKRKAFMDLLLDLHFKDASFTEDDIIEETVSFFTGANVTLGITLSHIFYCLGLYKDEQKIVQNELDEIFGNSSRDIAEEDLRSMTYLECFIKETLRLYPLTYISREAPEGLKIYDYDVPKESIVVIFIHKLHRDPEVFPNPEKFDPSRFFPENCIGRSPYAFIPFSAGPRNCIAHRFAMITLKTLVANALRHFDIFSMDERDKIDGNSMPDEKNFGYSIRMKLKPRTVAA
ncbi:cytochrome P450 4V2 [Parasteatoda tepidariorum]|uniref:cytochrome P450 4V2 n=1 Tax=Parasteatoda tepidariorum TaxID=114398 RepID=UPI0039BC4637